MAVVPTTTHPKAPGHARTFVIVGMLLMLCSLLFGGVGYYSIQLEREYVRDGKIVKGTVLSKRIEERWEKDSDTGKSKKRTSYIVGYRFQVPNEGVRESSHGVAADVYEDLHEGQSVDVQYLSRDLDVNRVAQEPEYVFGYVFMGFGAVLFIAGAALVGSQVKGLVLRRRLVQEGNVVDAVVRAVMPGTVVLNNVQQWRISYAFRDNRGVEHLGVSDNLAPDVARQWKEGDRGKILLSRNDVSLHTWVGKVER